ncbi:MAG: tRNA (adenosine(37)-N6)-threonylcarbamoyltransferase complex ATPase subunit type 1 TsaE [Bacteroidales bacterium]
MPKYSVNDIKEWSYVAKKLLEDHKNSRIFAFYGKMGVGKTTFIRSLCTELGIEENDVASPTFSIVNEYDSKEGKIFHFDFYRIKDLREVFDLGFEEYIYSGSYCFIEWSELIEALLPDSYVRIEISEANDRTRLIISELAN